MTVINGSKLLELAPIKDMCATKIKANGVSHGLSEAGYDIRIKQDIWFKSKVYFPHPFRMMYFANKSIPNPQNKIIPNYEDGNFCLASAIEEFQMPNNLVGIVHDKSTWARQGLSVFNTVIEPGFKGGLTLELVYHGQKDLYIPAGSGIAQVIFHELSCEATYDGKYQGQSTNPVESIFTE